LQRRIWHTAYEKYIRHLELSLTHTDSDIRSISGTSFNNVHICGGGGFIRNNNLDTSAFLSFEINPMFGDLKEIIFSDSLTGFAVSSLNQAIIKNN